MFSSIHWPLPLPSRDNQKRLQILPNVPGGIKFPQLQTTGFDPRIDKWIACSGVWDSALVKVFLSCLGFRNSTEQFFIQQQQMENFVFRILLLSLQKLLYFSPVNDKSFIFHSKKYSSFSYCHTNMISRKELTRNLKNVTNTIRWLKQSGFLFWFLQPTWRLCQVS